MKRILTAAVLTIAAATSAFGWSDSGHKIVAWIAFRHLTQNEQAKIAAILEQHPRFAQDFKSKMPEGLLAELNANGVRAIRYDVSRDGSGGLEATLDQITAAAE